MPRFLLPLIIASLFPIGAGAATLLTPTAVNADIGDASTSGLIRRDLADRAARHQRSSGFPNPSPYPSGHTSSSSCSLRASALSM